MWLEVNGELRQNSSTCNFIFDVAALVSYVNAAPGRRREHWNTTRSRPGYEASPVPEAGDVVELGIEGLGESRQQVVNFSEQS